MKGKLIYIEDQYMFKIIQGISSDLSIKAVSPLLIGIFLLPCKEIWDALMKDKARGRESHSALLAKPSQPF